MPCTFADWGPDFGFSAHCRRCARHRRLTDADIERIGRDVDLDEVRARLRCEACGARDALLYRYWCGGMAGPSERAYVSPSGEVTD